MALELTYLTPLVQVFDMPAAVRFYCEVLGFEVVTTSPEVDGPEGRHFQWARLRRGAATLLLNTPDDNGERPAQFDRSRWSGHAATCLFIGCSDVDAAYEELRTKIPQLEPPTIEPYGMKQLLLTDADGYEICLQQPA
jgi:catechol 2,3-dioxygenase-like lactoylglutathione lyase family enzyme